MLTILVVVVEEVVLEVVGNSSSSSSNGSSCYCNLVVVVTLKIFDIFVGKCYFNHHLSWVPCHYLSLSYTVPVIVA